MLVLGDSCVWRTLNTKGARELPIPVRRNHVLPILIGEDEISCGEQDTYLTRKGAWMYSSIPMLCCYDGAYNMLFLPAVKNTWIEETLYQPHDSGLSE
jgi:hypothetical protein